MTTLETMSAAKRGRWANAGLFYVNGFLMGSWAPQIPFMLPRHGITEFQLGLLILLIGAGAVGAMAWAGWLINHYGSRRITGTFGIIACLSFAAMVLAPTIPLVIPLLVIFGASLGTMDVSMNANAVEIERRLNSAVMSSAHGFWSVGGFVGGGVGGLAVARFGNANHALLAAAVGLAVILAAIPFLVTETAHHDAETPKQKYTWPKGSAIYIIGFMALFSMIPEGAVLDWAALYLNKELGSDIATSGFAFAFFSGTMAIMRFMGDTVRDRFGAVQTMRISGFIAAAGMLAGGLAPSPWLAIAAFAVSGLGIANMVPIAFSAAGNQPGLSPGAGIALVTMLGYSGILVAPSSIGFVAEHIGYRITYITLAFCLVVVALLAGRVASADRVKASSSS
jgi:MFS family permease